MKTLTTKSTPDPAKHNVFGQPELGDRQSTLLEFMESTDAAKAGIILQGIAENRAELACIKNMVEDLLQEKKPVGSVKG